MNLKINESEVSVIIKDFIKTYVENSGCSGVVLGLSGGIDSSTAAVLCKQVLGKENLLCIFMPDSATPDDDVKHFEDLTKKFDIESLIIEIDSIEKEFLSEIKLDLNELSICNIKSRIRMVILYSYANLLNRIVCGTSNKSEMLIGYFTKYGDGGVDLQPLGDLYKTQIYDLARYLKIPNSIITKPPTAGLKPNQLDEAEIGIPYNKLDIILNGLENKNSLDIISNLADVTLSEVKRIKKMRERSQHKRRSPLIPKIGLRTPGLDWRSPIQKG